LILFFHAIYYEFAFCVSFFMGIRETKFSVRGFTTNFHLVIHIISCLYCFREYKNYTMCDCLTMDKIYFSEKVV